MNQTYIIVAVVGAAVLAILWHKGYLDAFLGGASVSKPGSSDALFKAAVDAAFKEGQEKAKEQIVADVKAKVEAAALAPFEATGAAGQQPQSVPPASQ